MTIATKIAALLENLTPGDVEAMPPAERERFAFLCSRWANIARRRPAAIETKAGVLASLRDGERQP